MKRFPVDGRIALHSCHLYKCVFPLHHVIKGKVKCTPVQALRLCTGRMAHRGNRGIALPFFDHGTRRGWEVSFTPRHPLTPGKDPVPIVQEAGWAPGPVWTGAENLDPCTVQPVASRYTEYTTRPTYHIMLLNNYLHLILFFKSYIAHYFVFFTLHLFWVLTVIVPVPVTAWSKV